MGRSEILWPWIGHEAGGPGLRPGMPMEILSFACEKSLTYVVVLQGRARRDGPRPVCLETVFQETFTGLPASPTRERAVVSYSSTDKL